MKLNTPLVCFTIALVHIYVLAFVPDLRDQTTGWLTGAFALWLAVAFCSFLHFINPKSFK